MSDSLTLTPGANARYAFYNKEQLNNEYVRITDRLAKDKYGSKEERKADLISMSTVASMLADIKLKERGFLAFEEERIPFEHVKNPKPLELKEFVDRVESNIRELAKCGFSLQREKCTKESKKFGISCIVQLLNENTVAWASNHLYLSIKKTAELADWKEFKYDLDIINQGGETHLCSFIHAY